MARFNPLFQVWHHYRKGHLPVSGGILDQPAVVMDALEIIEFCLQKVREEAQSGV
ncbi:MAG: hypothetical protein HQM00_01820 [Magnetococcales bacterium]|nr:hypothetical protein [Magnetococcales bacterium]